MKKQFYIILLLFVVIFSAIEFFNYKSYLDKKEQYTQSRINAAYDHYDVTYQTFKINSTHFYNSIVKNKKMIQILKDANSGIKSKKLAARLKLDKIFNTKYQLISKLGIDLIHFHLPDNESFFRRQQPTKYGDDLTTLRASVYKTNKLKQPQEGLEIGKYGLAFRFIFPIFDENKNHLGSLEGSITSSAFIDYIEKALQLHTHFIVSKESLHLKGKYIIKDYIQGAGLGNFVRLKKVAIKDFKHTKEEKAEIKEKLKLYDMTTKNPFSFTVTKNGLEELVIFIPILSFDKNKTIAYFVVFDDENEFLKLKNDYIRQTIVIFFISLILSFLLFKLINSKKELKIEVYNKTKELKELNENLEDKITVGIKESKLIEKRLFESEKMVSMGEMIGNIAHQWRQPLSVISTAATGMHLQKEVGILSDEDLYKTCTLIDSNAQYLSSTIDDFKNFIKGDRVKNIFNIRNSIDSFLHLIEGTIKKSNIHVEVEIDNTISIHGYKNELVQCLMNIFNNAKDILEEKKISYKLIIISCHIKDDNLILKIKDNAGGIPDDISERIFEPYFTTKHKSQGTGLGLHMTYKLIVEGMNGTIEAHNIDYRYNEENYKGAEFIITLPLS